MEPLKEDHLSTVDVQLDLEARQHLFEASKWAKFLSIVVFIGCGLLLIFGVIGGKSIINAMEKYIPNEGLIGGFGSAILLLIAFVVLIVAFIYYFLFQFGAKVKSSLTNESAEQMASGIRSLKTFFTISTIFAALSLLNTLISLLI